MSHKALALALVVISAVNTGLVGLVGTDVLSVLTGSGTVVARVVAVLVGLSGVWVAWNTWGGKK